MHSVIFKTKQQQFSFELNTSKDKERRESKVMRNYLLNYSVIKRGLHEENSQKNVCIGAVEKGRLQSNQLNLALAQSFSFNQRATTGISCF